MFFYVAPALLFLYVGNCEISCGLTLQYDVIIGNTVTIYSVN